MTNCTCDCTTAPGYTCSFCQEMLWAAEFEAKMLQALKDKVTNIDLDNVLEGYVTENSLDVTLDNYAKTEDLPDGLDEFLTSRDLDDYAKTEDIPDAPDLDDYVNRFDLADLIKATLEETDLVQSVVAAAIDKALAQSKELTRRQDQFTAAVKAQAEALATLGGAR